MTQEEEDRGYAVTPGVALELSRGDRKYSRGLSPNPGTRLAADIYSPFLILSPPFLFSLFCTIPSGTPS